MHEFQKVRLYFNYKWKGMESILFWFAFINSIDHGMVINLYILRDAKKL